MVTIGCLEELDVNKDDFDCYVKWMEQFFLGNDVPNAKKAVVFLSTIGARAYELLRWTQKDDESVAEYIVTLKQFLKHCDFGEFLNDALHDQFVWTMSTVCPKEVANRREPNL